MANLVNQNIVFLHKSVSDLYSGKCSDLRKRQLPFHASKIGRTLRWLYAETSSLTGEGVKECLALAVSWGY